MICIKCGTEIDENAVRCPGCGMPIAIGNERIPGKVDEKAQKTASAPKQVHYGQENVPPQNNAAQQPHKPGTPRYIRREDYAAQFAPENVKKSLHTSMKLYIIFSIISAAFTLLYLGLIIYASVHIDEIKATLAEMSARMGPNLLYEYSDEQIDMLMSSTIVSMVFTMILKIGAYITGFLANKKKSLPLAIVYAAFAGIIMSLVDLPPAIITVITMLKFNKHYKYYSSGYDLPPKK